MSKRLNKERELEFQPRRVNFAIEKITAFGYEISKHNLSQIQFTFKNETVTFFPYSGWASGKSIVDGRGLENLLKQIKL